MDRFPLNTPVPVLDASGQKPAAPAFTVVEGFPALFADIATPFWLFRNNLRRKGAVAHRIAKRRGEFNLFAIQCLLGVIYLLCKLIYRLLGADLAFTLRILHGAEGPQYTDPFLYGSESRRNFRKHRQSPQVGESADDTTGQDGAE